MKPMIDLTPTEQAEFDRLRSKLSAQFQIPYAPRVKSGTPGTGKNFVTLKTLAEDFGLTVDPLRFLRAIEATGIHPPVVFASGTGGLIRSDDLLKLAEHLHAGKPSTAATPGKAASNTPPAGQLSGLALTTFLFRQQSAATPAKRATPTPAQPAKLVGLAATVEIFRQQSAKTKKH